MMTGHTKEKQPAAKSLLLQTYLCSLLSLMLCVTMFFGTTYAWFTSEVNNVGNEIYIGILDVELEKQLADGTWASLSALEAEANKTKLFDSQIRWEPGYTSLETVKVINRGDLAFNYTLSFTDATVMNRLGEQMQNESWKAVADLFEVWVYDHRDNGNTAPTTASYKDMLEEGSGWEPVGSLTEILMGKTVLGGKMITVRKENRDAALVNPGTTDGVATEDTYTIALHMKESADMSVKGHKISLNAKLIAYQRSGEEDGFGSDYDQMVATPAELQAALKKGGMVALAADIDLSQTQLTIPAGVAVMLDLNGHNITGTGTEPVSLIANEGDLTILGNGKIAMVFTGEAGSDKAANAIANKGILVVNSGELSATCTDGRVGYAIDNYSGAALVVNGGKISSSGTYTDGIRLCCGADKEVTATINGGEISSVWAQNPSNNKEKEVKGTVIVNGGAVNTVFYENYTTVKVAAEVATTVTPYGAGNDKTEITVAEGYTVYSFLHENP